MVPVSTAVFIREGDGPREHGSIGIWRNILVQRKGECEGGSDASGCSREITGAACDRVNRDFMDEVADGHAMAASERKSFSPSRVVNVNTPVDMPTSDIHRKVAGEGVMSQMARFSLSG